eukprot:680773-Hanusia_phi.AAC.2
MLYQVTSKQPPPPSPPPPLPPPSASLLPPFVLSDTLQRIHSDAREEQRDASWSSVSQRVERRKGGNEEEQGQEEQ